MNNLNKSFKSVKYMLHHPTGISWGLILKDKNKHNHFRHSFSHIWSHTLDEDLFDEEGDRSRFSFSALGRRDLLRLSDGIFTSSLFLTMSI